MRRTGLLLTALTALFSRGWLLDGGQGVLFAFIIALATHALALSEEPSALDRSA